MIQKCEIEISLFKKEIMDPEAFDQLFEYMKTNINYISIRNPVEEFGKVQQNLNSEDQPGSRLRDLSSSNIKF